MPVPLDPETTFGQMRDHLIDLGCTYETCPVGYSRDPLMVFENAKSNKAIRPSAIVKDTPDKTPMAPFVIRSICDQLEIDPAEFGFNYP